MGDIRDVTTETFQKDVLESPTLVIVDFWTEWCAPCRQLAPTLKALAETYAGKLRIAKVDGDASRELVQAYRVQAFPTLLYVKDGKVRDQTVGNQSRASLEQRIQKLL